MSKFQTPSFIFGPVMAATTTRARMCTFLLYRCLYFLFPTLATLLFSVCNRHGERTSVYEQYIHIVPTLNDAHLWLPKSHLVCSASRSQEFERQLSLVAVTIMYPKLIGRSQWPRGLRRESAAARLLGLWVRTLPGAWMFVCCECCVLSGGGLGDELTTSPEESYRMRCVTVCDLETSRMRSWPELGRSPTGEKEITRTYLW